MKYIRERFEEMRRTEFNLELMFVEKTFAGMELALKLIICRK